MILTAAAIGNPGYVIQTWHIYLTLLLILVVSGLITMQSTKTIGRINIVGTWINLIALIIFVIWLPAGSINKPKFQPNDVVWTSQGFVNGTEWPIGFATLMGFLSVIWTMSGYDAPFHLSEECSNANVAAPRAIVMTAQLGFYLGFPVILVIAYCVTDIDYVVAGALGQPMGALCLQVLGPKAGLAMFAINIIAQWCVELGCIIAGSRVIYAYSRDGALPGSKWWKQVNKHTLTPVNALWFDLAINALLGLLMFASPVAIGAVFSIGAIAQYTAFTIPIALRLTAARDKFRPGKRPFPSLITAPHTQLTSYRPLEPRPLVQALRVHRLLLGCLHHPHPLLSCRQGRRAQRSQHELHMSDLRRRDGVCDALVCDRCKEVVQRAEDQR